MGKSVDETVTDTSVIGPAPVGRFTKPNDSDSSSSGPSGAVDPAGGLRAPGGRCWRCGDPWEQLLRAHQKRPVCNDCFLALFEDFLSEDLDDDWNEVMAMSEAELEAELKASGVDLPAFIERVKARVAKAIAEEGQ